MALEQLGKKTTEGCQAPGQHKRVINVDADGKTLVAADSGARVVFTAAAASALVLPAPVAGMEFEVITGITNTGDHTVTTDAATTFLGGGVVAGVENTASKVFHGDGTSDVVFTTNGTTKGGIIGDVLKFKAISSTVWMVEGILNASGTVVTPFS